MDTKISRAILANLISKPETRIVEYFAMTKEEKINHFATTYAKEIARIKPETTHKFSKVRAFKKYTETTDENGKKVTRVNDDYLMKAISFVATIGNLQLVQEFTAEILKGDKAVKEVFIPFVTEKQYKDFSQEETIEYYELQYGRPENGQIEVETGYGKTLIEFLTANGFNMDALK